MPLLSQIVRDLRPMTHEAMSLSVVWSGVLERRGQCRSLLNWTGDGRNLHGSDSLAAAGSLPLVNRGVKER